MKRLTLAAFSMPFTFYSWTLTIAVHPVASLFKKSAYIFIKYYDTTIILFFIGVSLHVPSLQYYSLAILYDTIEVLLTIQMFKKGKKYVFFHKIGDYHYNTICYAFIM